MKFDKINTLIVILVGLLAIMLGSTLYLSVASNIQTHNQATKNTAFLACVSDWANKTAERSSVLTDLNLERQNKLDTVMRNFASAKNPNHTAAEQEALRVKFFHDFDAWVKTSNEYKKAVKSHPLPEAPKFACANGK